MALQVFDFSGSSGYTWNFPTNQDPYSAASVSKRHTIGAHSSGEAWRLRGSVNVGQGYSDVGSIYITVSVGSYYILSRNISTNGQQTVSLNLTGTTSQAISNGGSLYLSLIATDGGGTLSISSSFRIGQTLVTQGNPIKATDFTAVGLSATVGQPIKLSGASGVIDDTWFNNNYGKA